MKVMKAVLKRPAATAEPVLKRPAAVDDESNANSRADRNKKNHYVQNMHSLPEGMRNMVEKMPCHQRGQLINSLVKRDDHGAWCFDLTHPYVEDMLCATVIYSP